MYYVYLLESQKDKSWYIGFTANIEERVNTHNHGKGGRTTRMKSHWKLIYHEMYLNKMDAIGREKFLKSGSGRRYLKKQLSHYLKSV